MGNDQADAMRAELHDRLIRAYGDLKTAAAAMGIPYKTLYRALTTKGKDRTATVTLDLIVQVVNHLQDEFGGDDFGTVYAAALKRHPNGYADNVVHHDFGRNVGPVHEDDLEYKQPPSTARAAKRGTRKADAEPHAD